MKITSSYNVKINKTGFDRQAIIDTYKIYRNVVKYFISIINNEYDNFIKQDKRIVTFIEKLTHKTKQNPDPKYDFDSLFYKLPSYFRRSAINDAFGIVNSYKSNMDNYIKSKSKKKPTKLQYNHNIMPTFYQSTSGVFKWEGKYTCKIKVYKNNDWVWLKLNLRPADVKYVKKHEKTLSPTLKRIKENFYLIFPVEDNIKLKKESDLVIGVDLGLNALATLCIMNEKGTIYKRHFIKNKKETDLLNHLLNKKKKYQKRGLSTKAIYREINSCQTRMEIYVCKEIIKLAKEYNVDLIVLEYLSSNMKAKGSYKEKIHLWRKKAILKRIKHMAHLNEIKYSTVSARNTSKLAFDGSGIVVRNKNNYALCVFPNGKKYNADLNASYNIAARYFIREKLKTYEKHRSLLEAKVPLIYERTKHKLSDLINLNVVIEDILL